VGFSAGIESMKIMFSNLLRQRFFLLLIVAGFAIWILISTSNNVAAEDPVPVVVVGVQHLGREYLIERFYIDKRVGDSVGEYGGGGSERCCVTLPKKWNPNLEAEVRWEVRKIIRSSNPSVPDSANVIAIYKANVPIEKYKKPASFWVHFFSDGKVRIVVTPISFEVDGHPIIWGDIKSSDLASKGKILNDFFSTEEISEFVRQADIDKREYGDLR